MAPTDTQFENLKKRVKGLEEKKTDQSTSQPASWNQRNQLLTWLISLTVPTVALIIAVYAGVIPHIEKHIDDQVAIKVNDSLKQPLQNMGQMSIDIAEIKGTLKAWAPFVTPQFLKKTVSLPDRQFLESLPQLKAVARTASESNTEVPAKDIASVGKRTIALASGNSSTSALAWETTLALLQYQSVMNAFSPPIDTSLTKPVLAYSTKYLVQTEPGLALPQLKSTTLTVPRENAAALDLIGQDRNKNSLTGPAMLEMVEGNLTLDGMHLKNVVLVNVHVIYKGGASELENVYFLNCTFQITRSANGIELADNILTNPAIHLSVS